MRTFTVYHHPIKGYEAVKQGFSWPGFFFTWIWAFVKRLVAVGFVLFLVWLFVGQMYRPREPNVLFLYFGVTLAVQLLVGIRGNKWREGSLVARGYQQVETVQAPSPDAAAHKAIENQAAKAVVDAAVKDVLDPIALERGSQERQRSA